MILVFDENLSPGLSARLADCHESSSHVETLGLKGGDDIQIWERVQNMDSAIIVSKDDDFRELALTYGPPPKVLMLLLGNCSTDQIENLLRKNESVIREFADALDVALLELGSGLNQ